MVKMNNEAAAFIARWNAAKTLGYEARRDEEEDIYLEYREAGKMIDFYILREVARSIDLGNEMPVVTELGGCYDAECYSDFFKEYGIEKFAFCTSSTAAVKDIVTFLHEDWEVAGYTTVNVAHRGEVDAIVFH